VAKPLELLAKLCSTPGTDEPLAFAPDASARSAGGRRFRAVSGVPVLRDEPPVLVHKPVELASGGVPPDRIEHMKSLPGYTLFLGAGNSNFRSPRVIEVEHDLFRDTDVVADAHRLPFRSGSFDLFFAMNVFEHLEDPPRAAREALRVLRPGGEGVELHVSPNFNPLHSVAWLASDLLAAIGTQVGPAAARRIGALTLDEVAGFWRHQAAWNPEAHAIFTALPEPAQRATAAGFDLRARKPS
jgi:SAM-dependent methyltransferase